MAPKMIFFNGDLIDLEGLEHKKSSIFQRSFFIKQYERVDLF